MRAPHRTGRPARSRQRHQNRLCARCEHTRTDSGFIGSWRCYSRHVNPRWSPKPRSCCLRHSLPDSKLGKSPRNCAGAPAPVPCPSGHRQGHRAYRWPWQFHLGDDLRWAQPSFDDSGWAAIRTDDTWGDQGYPSYYGICLVPAPPGHRSGRGETCRVQRLHLGGSRRV